MTQPISIAFAITHGRPDARGWSVVDNDYATLAWPTALGEKPTQQQIADWHAAAVCEQICDAVDVERDRRIENGFDFMGATYQAREKDMRNINGAGSLAGFAVITGAPAGDYRWADPAVDFAWIAADNTEVLMDAQTCFAFSKAAAAHVKRLTFTAKAIKDLCRAGTPPADISDDALWQ